MKLLHLMCKKQRVINMKMFLANKKVTTPNALVLHCMK
jgi:hypothetical protein